MLRRKFRKTDNNVTNGSFSYSKVEGAVSTKDSLQEDASNVEADIDVDERSSWSADEKKIFEDQLESLQDQLIASMMENQKLAEQIQVIKEDDAVEQLHQEKRELQEKLDKLEKVLHRRQSDAKSAGVEEVDMDEYNIVKKTTSHLHSQNSPTDKHWLHPSSLIDQCRKKMLDFLSDFVSESELSASENPAPSLAYKRLKENCQRIGKSSKPFRKSISAVLRVLRWKSVPLTLVMFLVYMYSVWTGWLLQVILFYLIFELSINFLQASGLAYQFGLTSSESVEGEIVGGSTFDSLKLADKVQLVKKVAQTVQVIITC